MSILKRIKEKINSSLSIPENESSMGLADIDKKRSRPTSRNFHFGRYRKGKERDAAGNSNESPSVTPDTSNQDQRIADRKSQLQSDGVLIGDSMTGKSHDAINAEIKRRKWDEFEKNDMPYILNYADTITSGEYTQRAVDQAREGVDRGFNLAQQSQQMRDTGMGIGLSDMQKTDRSSDMKRNKTAALIDAENNARLAATDRENALLAGSMLPKAGG